MENLSGRTAVVTGAGGGIGRSIALSLARAGVNVAISDIDEPAAQAVAAEATEIGVRSVGVRTDVSRLEDVERLAETAFGTFGAVDILVNNAGVTMRPFRASWDTDYRDFQWVMNVNFWGVLNGFHAFVPRMRATPGEKHIVSTSSASSLVITPGHSAYSASKAAGDALSMCVRAEFELSGQPIGVSILFPGGVKTRISTSERLRPETEQSENRSTIPWSSYLPDPAQAARGAEDQETIASAQTRRTTDAIDPGEVGPMVVEGIRHNRPFILTHPAPADAIRDRADQLLNAYQPIAARP
ncbi:SDR family NAD(P)-dependent oxidoreductase [Actinomadura sp. LOL_016]|uniref:SDR family NAD(P)-dependent oxidoreductase n=1 Tax=unclassified Actinomadura TaxID=2626254 RepID=UPI003A7F898C